MARNENELTVSEAVKVTGLSRGTIWSWAARNKIPHRRRGLRRDILFDAAALQSFCKEYGYWYDEEMAESFKKGDHDEAVDL